MNLVSVGSDRSNVNVWVTPNDGSKPEPLRLSHKEAVSLARQLLGAVETYLPDNA
jgi:hypothetical protein